MLQADAVDIKPQLEKECHSSCTQQWQEYEKCKERIKAKGEGSCEPWAFDYWKCIDKCVSKSIDSTFSLFCSRADVALTND